MKKLCFLLVAFTLVQIGCAEPVDSSGEVLPIKQDVGSGNLKDTPKSGAGEGGDAAVCNGDRFIGHADGPEIDLPLPSCVSIITLRDVSSPPASGDKLKFVYDVQQGPLVIWWILVRETHVGGRFVAGIGHGGSDAPPSTSTGDAVANVVFDGKSWILESSSGAVVPGPDASNAP